jgi:hypothetical protein
MPQHSQPGAEVCPLSGPRRRRQGHERLTADARMTKKATKRRSTKQLLTPKQARFLKELRKATTQAQAVLKAGYETNNPDQTASNVLARIIRRAPEALERCGLDLETLVKKRLVPALGAKETKFFAWEGEVTDSRDVVAWDARLKSLDMAFRLHGAYPKNGNGNGNHAHVGGPTFTLVIADAGRAQQLLEAMAVHRGGG